MEVVTSFLWLQHDFEWLPNFCFRYCIFMHSCMCTHNSSPINPSSKGMMLPHDGRKDIACCNQMLHAATGCIVRKGGTDPSYGIVRESCMHSSIRLRGNAPPPPRPRRKHQKRSRASWVRWGGRQTQGHPNTAQSHEASPRRVLLSSSFERLFRRLFNHGFSVLFAART